MQIEFTTSFFHFIYIFFTLVWSRYLEWLLKNIFFGNLYVFEFLKIKLSFLKFRKQQGYFRKLLIELKALLQNKNLKFEEHNE